MVLLRCCFHNLIDFCVYLLDFVFAALLAGLPSGLLDVHAHLVRFLVVQVVLGVLALFALAARVAFDAVVVALAVLLEAV